MTPIDDELRAIGIDKGPGVINSWDASASLGGRPVGALVCQPYKLRRTPSAVSSTRASR